MGILERLASRQEYTPDFPRLRLQDHVLVFNYFKEFKLGRELINLLYPKESAYLGKAYTAMDNYVMKELQSNSETRVLFKNDVVSPTNFSPLFKSHVKGELYALTPEALLNMDRVIGNNHRFYREEKFVVPKEQSPVFKHQVRTTVKVYMYFGVEKFWENYPMIKSHNSKDTELNKWMWS